MHAQKYQFDRHIGTLPNINHFKEPLEQQALPIRDNFYLERLYNLMRQENVIFLDAYNKKHTLVIELEQLLEDKHEWEAQGVPLQKASVQYAIKFVHNSLISKKLPVPDIEVHPDGEIAFTWRKQNSGIVNIAFNKEGIATWAAYLLTILDNKKEVSRTIKGRFHVENAISDIEKNIILQISESQKKGYLAS
jgi:hypothetical protein